MNLSTSTRALIWERDQGRCFRCGVYLQYGMGWYSIHHRIPRGMGGSKDERLSEASNLLLLCGTGTTGCHGHIERNRDEALEDGWLVRRHDDPAEKAVIRWRKQWVRLTNEGGLIHIGNRTWLPET